MFKWPTFSNYHADKRTITANTHATPALKAVTAAPALPASLAALAALASGCGPGDK